MSCLFEPPEPKTAFQIRHFHRHTSLQHTLTQCTCCLAVKFILSLTLASMLTPFRHFCCIAIMVFVKAVKCRLLRTQFFLGYWVVHCIFAHFSQRTHKRARFLMRLMSFRTKNNPPFSSPSCSVGIARCGQVPCTCPEQCRILYCGLVSMWSHVTVRK